MIGHQQWKKNKNNKGRKKERHASCVYMGSSSYRCWESNWLTMEGSGNLLFPPKEDMIRFVVSALVYEAINVPSHIYPHTPQTAMIATVDRKLNNNRYRGIICARAKMQVRESGSSIIISGLVNMEYRLHGWLACGLRK